MPSVPSAKLIPELTKRRDEFEAAKRDARTLAESFSDEQFNWKPASNRWSVAQCLNHLNVFGFLILGNVRSAIKQARDEGKYAEEPFRYGLVSRWFVRMMEPNPTFGIPTVASYEPGEERFAKEVVLPRFEELQDDLIGAVEEANGLDLANITVTSPVVRLMRFPLGAWLAATEAHERRHLAQARGVTEQAGFPKS